MADIKLTCGILAGGLSSRMGSNKALLKYRNETFLERSVREFCALGRVLVSEAYAGEYTLPGVEYVIDEHKEIGPVEGIYQVLEAADTDYVFVCAVDMPFLKRELAEYMAEYISSDYDCYVLKDETHIHPLCAIYSKRLLPLIKSLIEQGQYRLMAILNQARTKYISLEYTVFDKKLVHNVNTKEELLKVQLPIVFAVSGTKNSGKSWLINKLINEFIKEGFSVGTIKHDAHGYEMDHEGTDSYSFYKAGALYSAIYAQEQLSFNSRLSLSADEILKAVPYTDIVICEGLKEFSIPKIHIMREAVYEAFEMADPVICRVADSEALLSLYSDNDKYLCCDTSKIYACVKKYFGL